MAEICKQKAANYKFLRYLAAELKAITSQLMVAVAEKLGLHSRLSSVATEFGEIFDNQSATQGSCNHVDCLMRAIVQRPVEVLKAFKKTS